MSILSRIPVLGWFLAFVFAFLIAIPLWFLWSHLGPIYFTFMPDAWIKIGFWDTVFLVWFNAILKALVFPKTGSLISFKPQINTKPD